MRPTWKLAPLAAAAILFVSCGGQNPLERQVEESNSRLPEPMEYGMTLQKLEYADSAVKAYIDVEGSEIRLNTLRMHYDRLNDDFARYMREQPDSTDIGKTVALIKEEGAALQMLFCGEADTVAFRIEATEL
ncbi:MAG: hypothetical protein NC102_05975 [Clostridium sp.]|nr:hypothetical protein [Clostridium sp.]